jgi:hypothetical protein
VGTRCELQHFEKEYSVLTGILSNTVVLGLKVKAPRGVSPAEDELLALPLYLHWQMLNAL